MNSLFDELLVLEKVFPHTKRKKWRKYLVGILFIVAIALVITGHHYLYGGIFLLILPFLMVLSLIDAYYYSTYIYLRDTHKKTYPVASIFFQSIEEDAVKDFVYSNYGSYYLLRLGLTPSMFQDFVSKNPTYAPVNKSTIDKATLERIYSLPDYASFLVNASSSLDSFFKEHAVTEKHIQMVGKWIEEIYDEEIDRERWWSREHLARIPGIGKDWAYGQTDILERFGQFIGKGRSLDLNLYKNEVEALESVLVKNNSANALVIGDTDSSRMAIIKSLATMIAEGTAYPELQHKKVFILESLTLSQKTNNATDFENQLSGLLYEAHRVGNVILVIDNLGTFMESGQNLGVDVMAILVPYLRGASLQCVALSETNIYYHKLQAHRDLSEHFELIRAEIKDDTSLIYVIEDQALRMESRYGVFYTYQAIEAVAEASTKYFEADVVTNKAVDLVLEIAPSHATKDGRMITRADVLALVQAKTGIPVGEITSVEKNKLLSLEATLEERVVGQEEAAIAISQAIRRSRSGISKGNKPMGSFIFLGPTGVGKTEMTKALGDIFFGPTVPIVRFDMSEYAGADGLERLIGKDVTDHASGILSTNIRQHQYGILLLDEFEKANDEVHNLFLQILDEGYFSDGAGKEVNVRNMIIIATSNAVGDLIIATPPNKLSSKKEFFINEIISRGIFRPELLNRFDGIIFFHALDMNNLESIAKLMLGSLAKRLKEKGIELIITPDLVQVLMEKGIDPHFGARPMNRAVADLVEEKIAAGLLQGNIKPGSKVSFTRLSDGTLQIQ